MNRQNRTTPEHLYCPAVEAQIRYTYRGMKL